MIKTKMTMGWRRWCRKEEEQEGDNDDDTDAGG